MLSNNLILDKYNMWLYVFQNDAFYNMKYRVS